MNESANDQGSVVGKAVGTTLGLSASVALTGAGLLMGGKAIKKAGRTIKNTAKGVMENASSIKAAKTDKYVPKHAKTKKPAKHAKSRRGSSRILDTNP